MSQTTTQATGNQQDQQKAALPPGPRIVYPPGAGAVIDVTQAPYFVDNTGQKDCTETLIGILDEIAKHSMEGMKRTMDILSARTENYYRLPNSFENRREGKLIFGIFPNEKPPGRIIYFPKGTYLVSDTICYSMDNLRNGMGAELNWHIRFQGESREECVIKLKDHCKGFEYGMSRPVVSFIRGVYSNVAMGNYFRNLTIDVGTGNPGAIGLEFFGNNCAGIRDVTIRSSDPGRRGEAGISITRKRASGMLFNNVEIEGFDYAVRIMSDPYMVMDNVVLRGQLIRGIAVEGNGIISIRNLKSENRLPALSVNGIAAHVVLVDADLRGGLDDAPAFEGFTGHLFLRNIRTQGYRCALGMPYDPNWGTDPIIHEKSVGEYVSDDVCTLSDKESPKSLNLEPMNAPVPAWELDFDKWIHPGVFGAVGDGTTDDTAAIQQAMDSGKPVIYFQPGKYLIDAPIRIPATVKQVNFMHVDLVSGSNLRNMRDKGMFTISEESPDPLLMEDLFSFEANYGFHYLIDHASTRTLIARNLHSQSCASYRNSVPGGTVFMDSVVSTTGIFDPTYQRPCFVFTGQKAWCRQLDPEYAPDKTINDGSLLYVMGFKTEGHGVAFVTRNGGQTEVLGGVLCFGANDGVPAVLNENSDVSFVASTKGTTSKHLFNVAVKEVSGSVVKQAMHDRFPIRFHVQYVIPLYAGRLRGKVGR